MPICSCLKQRPCKRTSAACKKVEDILLDTPGVEYVTTIAGFSLLSQVNTTYNGFFFVSLKSWDKRKSPQEQIDAIMRRANQALAKIPDGIAFSFPPPAIPGIGTSGGVVAVLEDLAGMPVEFLAQQTQKFMEAVRQRPEVARVLTAWLPSVPQLYLYVDQDKVLKQGVRLSDVYKTAQVFMGGMFVNYFNLFERTWQTYVEADGPFRMNPGDTVNSTCVTMSGIRYRFLRWCGWSGTLGRSLRCVRLTNGWDSSIFGVKFCAVSCEN